MTSVLFNLLPGDYRQLTQGHTAGEVAEIQFAA